MSRESALTQRADPPQRADAGRPGPDTASDEPRDDVPPDSAPVGLAQARLRHTPGGASFDPAKDTIYSDFTASVQDMLDALQFAENAEKMQAGETVI